ncbi:hypothetical protein A9Q89_02345 [Gammaproteobacteria bacterium 53_120_T64]|nr:hypothetical protein A9Q89_02345 [Gammaproteobacteria bacterium 53_120_T64]
MSVKIPSSFGIDLDGDFDIDIPTTYAIGITDLPQIDVNLHPLDIKIQPLDIKVQPLDINIRPLEIKPLDISLRLKEIPSIRAHLPLNYKVGFSLLGREIAGINLCGQGQLITEPYQAYPCEAKPSAVSERNKLASTPSKGIKPDQ